MTQRLATALPLLLLPLACGPAETTLREDPAPAEEEAPFCEGLEAMDTDGEPAPHSAHHGVRLGHDDITEASVEIRVREVPNDGLRFFALQVGFGAGEAWAHGGLMRDPSDGHANWGGLKSDLDYGYEGHELEVLAVLQNENPRTQPVSWEKDTWYRHSIRRGELTTLPAGEYSVLDDEPVLVEEERQMWRWTYEVRRVGDDHLVWSHDLFTAPEHITSMSYWTETGYGVTCTDRLVVDWRSPSYVSASDAGPHLPKRITKSLAQSSCPAACTTDVVAADHEGTWGTTQTFGMPRGEASAHGQVLYLR
jgi:hypothetical protein